MVCYLVLSYYCFLQRTKNFNLILFCPCSQYLWLFIHLLYFLHLQFKSTKSIVSIPRISSKTRPTVSMMLPRPVSISTSKSTILKPQNLKICFLLGKHLSILSSVLSAILLFLSFSGFILSFVKNKTLIYLSPFCNPLILLLNHLPLFLSL